jgi:hypothetical protein
MGKYRVFVCALVVLAFASPSCAQKPSKQEANLSAVAGPELRWKYDTGG